MNINIVQVTNKSHPHMSIMYYLCHDLVQSLIFSLEDLGHNVIFQKDIFHPTWLNIIVTGFNIDSKTLKHLKIKNIKYIVYQAEIFSDMGLNNDNPTLVRDYMALQDHYLDLLKSAIHVWDCFKFNQVFLKNHGINSSFIHHGYHPKLEGYEKKRNLDVDVVFFGSFTDYRRKILKRLHSEGLQMKILNFEPPAMRNDALRRAKVNLSIRANPTTMAHLQHSRIMTGLYFHTMTVSDPVYGQEWLHPMMDIVSTEDITSHVTELIKNGSYKTKSEEYSQMYRQHLMTDIMGLLMEELQDIVSIRS